MIRAVADDSFVMVDDFRVNNSAFQTQSDISFSALPGGGFIAVWADQDGFNDPGIKAQIFDVNGREVGAEFFVNLTTAMVQTYPNVTTLASGNFVITWVDERAFPATFDIAGQMFGPTGARIGPTFTANTVTSGFQLNPVVVALADGGFLVTWTFGTIQAQRYDAGGQRVGSEFSISTGNSDLQDVVSLVGGGFVVTWYDQSGEVVLPSGDLSSGIKARIYDSNSNAVGGPFGVNSFVPGTQNAPTIAALPAGGFVAAWVDDGIVGATSTGHRGMWFQIFDAAGGKVGVEVKFGTLGPFGQSTPQVEVVPDKGFLLIWKDSNASGSNDPGHLRAQLYDFSGAAIGAEFAITATSHSGQSQPDISALANGSIIVGWTDLVLQPTDENVRAQMLFATVKGTATDDVFIGTANRDFYFGYDGSDQASGGADADGLFGGAGNDTLLGEGGDDWLEGGAGNDLLNGGSGADSLTGNSGNDTYVVDDAGDSVTEALDEGIDTVQTTLAIYSLGANLENLVFVGSGAAQLTGNFVANTITGNSGNDILNGGGGSDSLSGGIGNDRIIIGAASSGSIIDGGVGTDALEVAASVAIGAGSLASIEAIELVGGATLTLTGTQVRDGLSLNTAVSGTGALVINMDPGVNALTKLFVFSGSGVAVTINGTAGVDLMKLGNVAHIADGGDGVDQIKGGSAADTIIGGNGNDKINGAGGADILTGGSGNDVFKYAKASDSGIGANADRITDFTIGQDKINFVNLDTNPGLAGIQSFVYVGTAAFSGGGAAQIRYLTSGADLIVQCDVNGDALADMEIILQGLAGQSLSASDFKLTAAAAEPPPSLKGIGDGGVDVLPPLRADKAAPPADAIGIEAVTVDSFHAEAALIEAFISSWKFDYHTTVGLI
jgi:Ca2+-binding RTX toxin-like protein